MMLPDRTYTVPMNDPVRDITALVHAADAGDRDALDTLFAAIYPDLRRLAHHQRAQRDGATLDTTGLVHECFLRFADRGWTARDRAHFLALASRVMRQVLVDAARERLAAKRGSGQSPLPIDDVDAAEHQEATQVIEVHELLLRLAEVNERQARVVECRFFAGLSESETAEALGISERSVTRDWAEARDWMRQAAGAP